MLVRAGGQRVERGAHDDGTTRQESRNLGHRICTVYAFVRRGSFPLVKWEIRDADRKRDGVKLLAQTVKLIGQLWGLPPRERIANLPRRRDATGRGCGAGTVVSPSPLAHAYFTKL